MHDETFTVERIENVSAFERLRDEWNEILTTSACDCLFLTWEWLFTWWKHLSEGRRLCICTVRCGSELVAIAPLATRPRRLRYLSMFPALEFLGMGSVGSDYLNLIIRPGAEQGAIKALAKDLANRKCMVELSQVERTARHAVDLGLQLKRYDWVPTRTTTGFCPYIKLVGHSRESYIACLGPSHRYNFRRRLRKIQATFDVRFEETRSEIQRRKALPLLVTLHHRRWYGRGGSDAMHKPALVAFHEEFSRIALERGWLRLYILWLDEKPAAALYGFNYKGTFYFYQSGFNPEYQKYSVGLVTMGLVIERAIDEEATEYDLLHGEEEYKFLWARDERELVRLELYPPRARGMFYRWATEAQWNMKKMAWKYLPPGVGEWIAPGRRINAYSKSWHDQDIELSDRDSYTYTNYAGSRMRDGSTDVHERTTHRGS